MRSRQDVFNRDMARSAASFVVAGSLAVLGWGCGERNGLARVAAPRVIVEDWAEAVRARDWQTVCALSVPNDPPCSKTAEDLLGKDADMVRVVTVTDDDSDGSYDVLLTPATVSATFDEQTAKVHYEVASVR